MVKNIREILDRAEDVKPIAEKDGKKIVTFEDAAALSDLEGVDPTPDMGIRSYNPDGSLAGIRTKAVAVNPKNYFLNRYKKSGKMMKLVIDWRAITEQGSGTIYLKNIPCYVFRRTEEGELYIEKVESVSDTDFVSDFTNTLDEDAMKQIAPLIANFGSEITPSSLPI